MSIESFLKEFQLSNNADIAIVEKLFLQKNKNLLATFVDIEDDANLDEACKTLVSFHIDFYDYAKIWLERQRAAYNIKDDHPDAEKLRGIGLGVLDDLQAYIIENSKCLFYINWYIEKSERIKRYIQEAQTKQGQKQIYNAADIGPIFARNRKLKDIALSDMKGLQNTQAVLTDMHEYFDKAEKTIAPFYKPKTLETLKMKIFSALRSGDFQRAIKSTALIKDEKRKFGANAAKADKAMNDFIELYTKGIEHCSDNFKDLHGSSGKAYVKPQDVMSSMEVQMLEIQRFKDFLEDHFLTYCDYRLDTLSVLRDQLQVHGQSDELPFLYSNLITGIAVVIADMKQLRTYESKTLDKITFLLKNHRKEIEKIKIRADDIIKEFESNFADYKELNDFTNSVA